MKKESLYLNSSSDGTKLYTTYFIPKNKPKGIIQFSHGMCEYQDYYYDMMEFFTNKGYITIINDHRGHGKSIKSNKDLGFFYDETGKYVVEDLYDVTKFIKEKYKKLPVYMFGHSMGSLIVRSYIKKYDKEIDKLIVCGSPSLRNAKVECKLLKMIRTIKGERYRSETLKKMALSKGNLDTWLSINKEYIDAYRNDPKCNYLFTVNGYINISNMLIDVYSKDGWALNNKKLKVLFIAGENDPIIINETKWHKSMDFLKNVGYKNVEYILYDGCKHAVFKDDEKLVCEDILNFIEK